MELSKTFDPKAVESALYEWWHRSGFFKPENQIFLDPNEPPFVITIPPPNVTGVLHMGHALTSAIEDLMTRYHRMKGARTLWVPGTDHAGIATQAVVERELAKKGRQLRDMTREEFLAEAWAWKEYSHSIITAQQKALGISVDWDREAFTMDEQRSRAVRVAFKTLYDRGLIYRAKRMINWDPVQLTSVSDLEVETKEEGEPGYLWYVRYPLRTNRWDGPQHAWGSGRWAEGATEWITVATTRPETILGDTAVMVNPLDERYAHLVACTAILPAINRPIPIIADKAVDMSFGSGAVKVTPAHDFTDYEVGLRHHLDAVEVMDEHGRMNEQAGPYAGLDRFKCRERLVEDLEREGLLVKVEPYMVRVGRGQRSGAIIEPRISLQWFCDVKRMAQRAAEAVRSGQLRIVPRRFEKTWFDWLDNIRDWCISRQLWWGHQIPIWYVQEVEENHDGRPTQYCALSEEEAYASARRDWGDNVKLVQDPDVLDTWFSSGLWPFSVLGWPDDTEDMRRYYPTTMLETGHDILFFWVARMVMLGLELTGRLPFTTVYLHGLIRSADGKKMSKSHPDKNIDPLELIDTYGTDAVRFFLVTAGTPGNDVKMDAKRGPDGKWRIERIEGARNFANKLWNASRYVLGRLKQLPQVEGESTDAEQWIRTRYQRTVNTVRRLMDEFQYGEAGRLIYDFIWSDFCDWYLELSKQHFTLQTIETLIFVLEGSLRLLHPFMPFVTEAIWQKLQEAVKHSATLLERGNLPETLLNYPALMLSPYPRPQAMDDSPSPAEQRTVLMQQVVHAIRNARAEHQVPPQRRLPAIFVSEHSETLQRAMANITALASLDPGQVQIARDVSELPGFDPHHNVALPLADTVVYLPLRELVNVDAERKRLQAELESLENQIQRSQALLAGDFRTRAPAQVVEKEQNKLASLLATRDKVRQQLSALESIAPTKD
ncbi:MAG: valine--tRNA ligase [Thermoflexales bacterium]